MQRDLHALHLLDVLLAQLPLDASLLAAEGHYVVAALDELLRDELADVAGGANHEHAHVLGSLAAVVATGSSRHPQASCARDARGTDAGDSASHSLGSGEGLGYEGTTSGLSPRKLLVCKHAVKMYLHTLVAAIAFGAHVLLRTADRTPPMRTETDAPPDERVAPDKRPARW